MLTQTDLWLSSVAVHELEYGFNLLPRGRRKDRIGRFLTALVDEYEDHILPIGRKEAEQATILRARAYRSGRVLHLGDALVAGTAVANGLTVVSRNVSDFSGLDISVVNPWEPL